MSQKKEKLTAAEKEAKKKLAEETKTKQEIRRERALFLHLSGASYRQIADQISKGGEEISKSTVERDINKMLDAMDDEEVSVVVTRMRKVQKGRINQLILAHWQAAASGNLKSGYFVRQLMKDLTELYGADAPVKVEQTGQVDAVNYTLAEWKAEQKNRREQAARTGEMFDEKN